MSSQNTVPRPSFLISRIRRRDFISLLVVSILFVVVLFTLLPAWVGSAASDSFLPASLHAKATADYSTYPLGTSFPALDLGIVEAVLRDADPFASDIESRLVTMTHEIMNPVPTSTMVPASATGVVSGLDQATSTPRASDTLPARTASPAGTGTTVPVSTNTVSVLSTSTSGGTATIAPTATQTVTLPPGVTATITTTPTRTVTLPAGETPIQGVCETYPTTGYVAVKDTWIDSDKPDTSNERAPKLQVEPGLKEKQALIHFDLTTIPAGRTVETATLYLHNTKSSTYAVEFFEITSEWPEDVTWNTQPDYELLFSVGLLALTGEQSGNCVRSVDLDTGLVERWIDSPNENYGIVMIAAGGTERTDFSSIDSNSPPRLVLTYP